MKTSHLDLIEWKLSQSVCVSPLRLETSDLCPLVRCRSWPSSDLPGHSDWRWKPTGAVNSHELHLGQSRLVMVNPHSPHYYVICTVSYYVYFGVYHKEMAIMKVSHKMGFRDSQSRDKLWYSATHFILQQEARSYENLWGICSYGVRVVLDEVPSRGHSCAWQSLLGVSVSKRVFIYRT